MLTDQKNSVEEFREQLNYTSDGARKRRGRGKGNCRERKKREEKGGIKEAGEKGRKIGADGLSEKKGSASRGWER